MVLFPFPFWEFLCLCEAMPDRWAQTVVLWGRVCVCVYVCVYVRVCGKDSKRKREGEKVYAKMWDAEMFEGRIILLCVYVSEDSLNYNCIAAQSRNSSQAQAKPCWTRLNRAWTHSAQHALRFKPWLIGPKASKSPFPAVTGTGLGKERDGEKEEENKGETERDYFSPLFISMHPRWINTILYSSLFWHSLHSVCTTFFIGLAGREPQMLHSPGCSLWVRSDV